ncbi:MAG: L,D-transpeptidase family protein [Wenzhouxiangellaceae bacterium]
MLRAALPIALISALFSDSLPASENWLYAPAPEAEAAAPASTPEARGFSGIPSSPNSRSAWVNQSKWLFERLNRKSLRIGDPVHIRIFKQSRELELYLQGRNGFELYRSYPICDMSGTLGPKRFEGDYQAPEGFYTIAPARLHPHSDFHLAFNLGYPNAFDRALERTGSNIMIHGGCASNGCFAMTDYYMEQIYLLAEAALRNGQTGISVEIYPFRMTENNLDAHASSRWIDFWRSLKPAHDHFVNTGKPAKIGTEAGAYRVLVQEPWPETGSVSASAP